MSAPMIAWLPTVSRIYKYLTTSTYAEQSIDISPVEIHDVETAPEKRPRTLKHLFRANHINYAILYHHYVYHNHMPHHLGSAYLFGANEHQLQKIYDSEAKELEEWKDSPAEITDADWRQYLDNKEYQRAYIDFFEDELALKFGYNWQQLMEEYLFSGKEPLINGVISGLGHPLIHLGYAFEFSSKELAVESLAMAATCHSYLSRYLDQPSYTRPSTYTSKSPLEIFLKVHSDTRFDGLFAHKGGHNLKSLFANHDSLILEHWNAWEITDPLTQFRDSQDAALALLMNTVEPGTHGYDFYLVHVFTTSHAVRILLPSIPKRFHISLVRQWFLLALALYICQFRPAISSDIEGKPQAGKGWKWVEHEAVNGKWATDAHFVKALRAMKEMARTWGDVHQRYLVQAEMLVDEFQGWTGLETMEIEGLDFGGGGL